MTLQDTTLAQMCATALARDPSQPALEFADTWVTWGELRSVADRVATLVNESGVGPTAPVVFVPRSRPSAVAAFLALLAQARTVRMVYAFLLATNRGPALEQLADMFVPVYLWRASTFMEHTEADTPDATQGRLNALCGAFERLRPSLVTGWAHVK